jgi:hypothetical protein
MARLRETIRVGTSALLSLILIAEPSLGAGAGTPPVGTVVSAQRARVGTANASVGTTIFTGDRLETDPQGSLQLRTNAARLLLSGSSHMMWDNEAGVPIAKLTGGTGTFSTTNSKALALRVGTAVIRPNVDEATIGSVSVLNPKELNIQCTRGALMLTVIDDTLLIPEGTAYHIVLDPNAYPAGEDPTRAWGAQRPKKSGRNRFIFFLILATAVVTIIGLDEAFESPSKP